MNAAAPAPSPAAEPPAFLTNCWQVAAYSAEIGHALLKRTIVERPLILYRQRSGAVTAMEDRYFWGHARNIRVDEDALTKVIQHSVLETFDQDKVVLEAQQIEVDRIGTIDPGVVLGIDAGPVQGRRILRAALLADA